MTLQRTAPATPDVPATPIGSNTQIVDTLRTAKSIFAAVEMEHDEPTADTLTQRIQAHEKSAWMLRSLLA